MSQVKRVSRRQYQYRRANTFPAFWGLFPGPGNTPSSFDHIPSSEAMRNTISSLKHKNVHRGTTRIINFVVRQASTRFHPTPARWQTDSVITPTIQNLLVRRGEILKLLRRSLELATTVRCTRFLDTY